MLEHGLLTAKEIQVICAWRFPQRVEMVVRAAVAYQKALRDVRQAEHVADLAADALCAAQQQTPVPGGLDLLSLADRQNDDAQRRLAEAQRSLGRASETFMLAAGEGAQRLWAVMVAHDLRAAREDLLAALADGVTDNAPVV